MRVSIKEVLPLVIEQEAKALAVRFKGVAIKAEFCRYYGINNTMLNQNLRGIKPISLRYAQVYAKAFNCDIADISKRLADVILSESPKSTYKVEQEKPIYVGGMTIQSNETNLIMMYRKLSGGSQRALDLLANSLYEMEHPDDLKANPTNGKKKKEKTA